jgi:hypothetical protein
MCMGVASFTHCCLQLYPEVLLKEMGRGYIVDLLLAQKVRRLGRVFLTLMLPFEQKTNSKKAIKVEVVISASLGFTIRDQKSQV